MCTNLFEVNYQTCFQVFQLDRTGTNLNHPSVEIDLDFFLSFERHFPRNCLKNGILFSKQFCNEQFEMPKLKVTEPLSH